MSKIEWTNETWNPITGCTRISPGCQHCYAERMAARLKAMGQPQYQNVVRRKNWSEGARWTGAIEFVPSALDKPLKRKIPTMYFVDSMSDLFHKDVNEDWLYKIWFTMSNAKQHTFQILTKRAELLPERVGQVSRAYGVLPNVWVGVSVESQKYAIERIPYLQETPAAVRFLSVEPLLGHVCLNLENIDWVILGGESGPGARPMAKWWPCDVRDQCVAAGVPFFFKQWGGVNKKKAGRVLGGRTWDEMPGVADE